MYRIVLVSATLVPLTTIIMAADAPGTSTWVRFTSFTDTAGGFQGVTLGVFAHN